MQEEVDRMCNLDLLDIEHGQSMFFKAKPEYQGNYKQHTQSPTVTGTSILGIVYKDGIMMAADCLASYGSLARFRDVRRLHAYGKNTVIGTSGEYSDLQYTSQELKRLMIQEYSHQDNHVVTPEEIYSYLSNLMYQRRTKMNPLWNSHVVGGFHKGKKFLGYVDLLGTTYSSSTIATGFGAHLAIPLLRKSVEGKENSLTENEATTILDDAMRVLFYRDARSLNKVQRAVINQNGAFITEPYSLKTDWSIGLSVRGYGA